MSESADDVKKNFISKLIKETIINDGIINIEDTNIWINDTRDLSFGSYYNLSFLDPFISKIWSDIPFLSYKSIYANSITKYCSSILETNKTSVFCYTANYLSIFNSLVQVEYTPAKKVLLIL